MTEQNNIDREKLRDFLAHKRREEEIMKPEFDPQFFDPPDFFGRKLEYEFGLADITIHHPDGDITFNNTDDIRKVTKALVIGDYAENVEPEIAWDPRFYEVVRFSESEGRVILKRKEVLE